MIMTDELIELKEKVNFLDNQFEIMRIEFKGALITGDISKAKGRMERLISEAQSTKEYTKTLLSKYQQEINDDKAILCLKLLRYVENIENVILALKEA